jgi:hypothetical protein
MQTANGGATSIGGSRLVKRIFSVSWTCGYVYERRISRPCIRGERSKKRD